MQEKNSEPVTAQLYFFPYSLVFLIAVEWFKIVFACFSKAKKTNFYQLKNFTLFKRTVFFIHKGYPLAGPGICK
jgi:hypothetical protein